MPYFLRRSRRVELEAHGHAVVVRGAAAALDEFEAALPASAAVLAADDGVLVIESDERTVARAASVATSAKRLRLEPAYRQVGGPPDDLWAPTGKVAVRFPEGWDRARIDAVLTRRGLRVREPIDEMPGGYYATTPDDPIEAARALVEEDGALFAEPDFIRRMRLRGAASSIGPRATPRARSSATPQGTRSSRTR